MVELLDGKVVAITGAGRGLGRAYALACAAWGARVVVNDTGGRRDGSGALDAAVAETVVAEIERAGGAAVSCCSSVADEAGARAVVERSVQAFGRLDGLVNNAGTLADRALLEMTSAEWDGVLDVHLKGTYLCSRFAAQQMVDQGEGGRIVNTTSMAGLIGNPGQANYAAAKAGIVGLTRTTALELARLEITVNAVAPLAKTRLTAEVAEIDDGARAEQVAPLVGYLLSDLSKDVTGRVFGVQSGHLFEYRTEMTRGVDRGSRGWEPDEIGRHLAEIGRSEADRLRAAASDDGRGRVDPERAALAQQVLEAVTRGFRPRRAGDWAANLHFHVEGCGSLTLTIADGTIAVSAGARGEPSCEVAMGDATFFGMASGAVDGEEAFMAGKISASNMSELIRYTAVIHQRRARAAVAEVLAQAGVGPTGEPA
ncbi:MAG: SDR family NAD(P)-dependent oxidoreductase [Deltaproteobacteria bacterium]|nr:SDR family NAD(P)-dependent oxidoreductase [Deltaproteobacteria bacterium]MBW2530383.1 SDR family NAD(P)-dependent oxidoreductase [Deltaproteobacteria bacterium]